MRILYKKLSNLVILLIVWFAATMTPLLARSLDAYPLDEFERTGINRLEGYLLGLNTTSGRKNLVVGQLLSGAEIKLSDNIAPKALPVNDSDFQASLKPLLPPSGTTRIAILDITNPQEPAYAAINGQQQFVPGSVGKIVLALTFFDQLAQLYPFDLEKRKAVLKQRYLIANSFTENDSHVIPIWRRNIGILSFQPISRGDRANIWSYLDWMLSASSNAAASMIAREIVTIAKFRKEYPPDLSEQIRFIKSSSPSSLGRLLRESVVSALSKAGLDPKKLNQTSLFTSRAKQIVQGSGSTANVHQLITLMYKMETGNLIDQFSSLALKKLLYSTQKRIRYASADSLDRAAVYYKAGSLFSCNPQQLQPCHRYQGTKTNQMNSIALIEDPARAPRLRYIVALSTDILRQNSSVLHAQLANVVHKFMKRRSVFSNHPRILALRRKAKPIEAYD
ncbi:MAG: serine hydrolase [Bdellovibrionales bacterium]|nr:serine hydrolase [Bdellovibrionales bacterium]